MWLVKKSSQDIWDRTTAGMSWGIENRVVHESSAVRCCRCDHHLPRWSICWLQVNPYDRQFSKMACHCIKFLYCVRWKRQEYLPGKCFFHFHLQKCLPVDLLLGLPVSHFPSENICAYFRKSVFLHSEIQLIVLRGSSCPSVNKENLMGPAMSVCLSVMVSPMQPAWPGVILVQQWDNPWFLLLECIIAQQWWERSLLEHIAQHWPWITWVQECPKEQQWP